MRMLKERRIMRIALALRVNACLSKFFGCRAFNALFSVAGLGPGFTRHETNISA
jgi:hypothetical protein